MRSTTTTSATLPRGRLVVGDVTGSARSRHGVVARRRSIAANAAGPRYPSRETDRPSADPVKKTPSLKKSVHRAWPPVPDSAT